MLWIFGGSFEPTFGSTHHENAVLPVITRLLVPRLHLCHAATTKLHRTMPHNFGYSITASWSPKRYPPTHLQYRAFKLIRTTRGFAVQCIKLRDMIKKSPYDGSHDLLLFSIRKASVECGEYVRCASTPAPVSSTDLVGYGGVHGAYDA